MNICSKWKECNHIKIYGQGCGHNFPHEPDGVCDDNCETFEGVRGARCHKATTKEEVLFRMTGKLK